MNTMIRKTLVVVGIACGLGLGVGAFADAVAPAIPPPPTPPAAASAEVHSGSKDPANGGWRGRRRLALHRRWMRRLAHRLHLDKSQRAVLRNIHSRAMAEIWAARADTQLTPEQRHARIRAAIETGRTAFRGLLTPEQGAKLDQIEERRNRRMMGL
jgi:hypothetical protein